MLKKTPGSPDPHGDNDLLAAIERGEPISTVTHEEALREDPVLAIEHFNFWYGRQQVLTDIRMPIPRGKITTLIGPSGCGKSTLLRCVNRLNDLADESHVSGQMSLNGAPLYDSSVDVIALRKRMGMVFQKSNPFPKSVYENVVYPLRIDGIRQRRRLDEACESSLRKVALWDEVKDRLRDNALTLSAGQQQRLCIARAIAAEPEILLMDEPCSALDPIATAKIEDLLEQFKGSYSILLVTHNLQQASRTSDFTAFMFLGRILEFGPTRTIFTRPRLAETNDFVTGRFG
ncbi:phosphate ABC transporter ATP-binding protein PstB [Planctomycetes bacterium Pan216]